METEDEEMVHVPGVTEWDGVRLHRATQNGGQFKTYALCVPGIFHVIF